MNQKVLIKTSLIILMAFPSFGQDNEHDSDNQKEGITSKEPNHFVSIALSGTFIPE